jgi:pimeloyl-ACP methyl ester carboxylesterase
VEGPLTAIPFPVTPAEQRTWIGAAQMLGQACSTAAGPIASAMSTTQDARDMDVLRRAVGDSKLTYFGLSFGSYLGEVYANMFPDRVRAVALDGIVDPEALVGTPATADVPIFDRERAPAASSRALHELLERCQQAGRSRCSFADADTPARYDELANRLKAHPLHLAAPDVTTTIYTYADLVADTEHFLHDPSGYLGLFAGLTDLEQLTAPDGAARTTTPWCDASWPLAPRHRRPYRATTTPSKPRTGRRALTACMPRTPPGGLRPPLRPTATASTSARSTRGSASRARGTPGPRRTGTSTGARSITAPPRPCWSSATGGTRPPATTTR